MKFFVFGAQPTLSLAELEAQGIVPDTNDVFEYGCFASHTEKAPGDLISTLGGIVKIGEVIDHGTVDKLDDALAIMHKTAKQITDGKIHVGISIYGAVGKQGDWLKKREKLGLSLKRLLKEDGHSVRYVSSKELELSSVIVKTNHLLDRGVEFCLFLHNDKITIGRTRTVQDFKAWSDRDFGRPARDARSGMLPPKLARMMINLAGDHVSEKTLLDPFCGSGTVLMEAVLLGFKRIIGTDVSEKAIAGSEKNIDWMKTDKEVELAVVDATQLSKTITDQADVVVAETFLGNPNTKKMASDAFTKQSNELITLYKQSLTELKSVLRPGGTAVIAFPIYRQGDGWKELPLKSLLEELSYSIKQPLKNPPKFAKFSKNGGLLYARDDQHVGRDILVFTH